MVVETVYHIVCISLDIRAAEDAVHFVLGYFIVFLWHRRHTVQMFKISISATQNGLGHTHDYRNAMTGP